MLFRSEQSVDGGTTWTVAGTDTTGQASAGTATPVYNSTTHQYEYTVARYYRLDNINTLVLYRIRVASTAANLSNVNCSFVATSSKIVHAVNCNVALPATAFLSGQVQDGSASLKWNSSNETANTRYIIERSNDQSLYTAVATVNGQGQEGASATYQFTDPQPITGPVTYRVRIVSNSLYRFSNLVLLSNSPLAPAIYSLINPFTDRLSFEITVPGAEKASFTIIDAYGRVIKRQQQQMTPGLNAISLTGLSNLAAGMYFLQVVYAGDLIVRQVVKMDPK